MYRCKECGTEYETKPDYCDCGNDEFEIFVAPEKEEVPAQTASSSQSALNSQSVQKEIKIPRPKFNPQPSVKKKSYSEFDRIKEIFDPVSTVIFIICLILSYFIVAHTSNPAPQNQKSETPQLETVNIPSIDSFWDDTPPSAAKPVQTAVEEKKDIEDTLLKKITAPIQKITQPDLGTKVVTVYSNNQASAPLNKPQTQKTVQAKPQAVQTPVKVNQPSLVQTQKSTQPRTQTQTQTQTKTQAASPSQSQNVAALTQRVQNNARQSVSAQTQQTQTSAVSKTQTSSQAQTVQTPQTQTTSASNIPVIRTASAQTTVQKSAVDEAREFANYKISLRNTIGKKINFSNVVGDGDCVVSFKINQSGRLINREFTKQSSNLTLNNAVYSAMNSTPSFSAPPSGYKNETLHLKVNFYNGNFDISLY